jgi:hypothetical protein
LGTFCVDLVHFSRFWYHAPNKNLATLVTKSFRKKRCVTANVTDNVSIGFTNYTDFLMVGWSGLWLTSIPLVLTSANGHRPQWFQFNMNGCP